MEYFLFQERKIGFLGKNTGCMNGLAELYTSQRRLDEAESLLTTAVDIGRRTLGDDHPWTLTSMNGLAVVYKEQGKFDDAEQLLLEAIKGRRLKLGDTHPNTLQSPNPDEPEPKRV